MPTTTKDKNRNSLTVDPKHQQLRNVSSISSIGSPGSVYDQYFDAFNDREITSPKFTPNQALKLTHAKSNLSSYPVTAFDSNQPYDNDSDFYEDANQSDNPAINANMDSNFDQNRREARQRLEGKFDTITEVDEPELKSKAKVSKHEESPKVLAQTESDLTQDKSDSSREPESSKSNFKQDDNQETLSDDQRTPTDSPKTSKESQVLETKSSSNRQNDQEDKNEGEEEDDGDGDDGDGEGIYDYYDILGIEKTDDIENIINQFKKEVVIAGFSRGTEAGKTRIRELNEAFIILTDPDRKIAYDKTIETEDLSLVDSWKLNGEIDSDAIFSEVFKEAIQKEIFKPAYYFEPMSYVAGAIIGFILFSWPGLIIFAYLCGKIGRWEDNRCPPTRELIDKLSENQKNALLHALDRYMPES